MKGYIISFYLSLVALAAAYQDPKEKPFLTARDNLGYSLLTQRDLLEHSIVRRGGKAGPSKPSKSGSSSTGGGASKPVQQPQGGGAVSKPAQANAGSYRGASGSRPEGSRPRLAPPVLRTQIVKSSRGDGGRGRSTFAGSKSGIIGTGTSAFRRYGTPAPAAQRPAPVAQTLAHGLTGGIGPSGLPANRLVVAGHTSGAGRSTKATAGSEGSSTIRKQVGTTNRVDNLSQPRGAGIGGRRIVTGNPRVESSAFGGMRSDRSADTPRGPGPTIRTNALLQPVQQRPQSARLPGSVRTNTLLQPNQLEPGRQQRQGQPPATRGQSTSEGP